MHPTLARELTESVSLKLNKPVRIVLKFDPPGHDVDTKRGPRVMFTLTDERKLWLDPEDAERITREFPRAGTEFWICKLPGGRYDMWTGLRKAQPSAIPDSKYAPQPDTLEADLRASLAQRAAMGAKLAEPVPEPAGWENGFDADEDRKPAPPPPPPPPVRMPAAMAPEAAPLTQLERSMLAGVNACHLAQERARSLGFTLVFTGEDVRAIANTLMINFADGKQRQRA